MAISNDGFIYVAGDTRSPNFDALGSSLQNAFQGGGRDGFVVKFKAAPAQYDLGGQLRTPLGLPIGQATVTVSDGTTPQSQTTGATGTYLFTGLTEGNYSLTPAKNVNSTNGINIFDYFALANHLNGTVPIATPYKLVAADVDGSGVVNNADLTRLFNEIISAVNTLPQPWRFVPASYTFPDPANPFAPPYPQQSTYAPLNDTLLNEDFIGVKAGDINCDADPLQ